MKKKQFRFAFDVVCDMKICKKCKTEKPLSDFNIDKAYKDGFRNDCKNCQKEYQKDYRKNNKHKLKEYNIKNRDKILEYRRIYRKKNADVIKRKYKEGYYNYKEKRAIYYKENSEKIKKSSKKQRLEYYKKNKDRLNKKNSEWHKNNKDKRNKRLRERRKTNHLCKLTHNLRVRSCQAFKKSRWNKKSSTKKLLGCEYETAFKHIEKQFTEGMTWDNHGEWHIDHIVPLASAKTEEELMKLFHYTNLQPLWAKDNLTKGSKL